MRNRAATSIVTGVICGIIFSASVLLAQDASQEKIHALSLEEVTKLALKNNFDIQLAQYDAQIKQTDDGVARSIYDTVLDVEVSYLNDQNTATSTLAGNKTLENDYNLGVSKKLPIGATVGIDMTNNRTWTDSSLVTTNPSHESSLGVTVTQDFGKNFFGIQDRGAIKITKIDIENSDYTSLDRIEVQIAQVQKAYWDLVLALEYQHIEEEMVEKARELYELHQEKLKDGLVEYPEAYASEANYKSRLTELEIARNDVAIKNNALKLLLNISDEALMITPAQLWKLDSGVLNMPESLRLALENRRDYKRALNDVRSKNINVSMKKNNMWPEINLNASLMRNGLGDHFKQAVQAISEEDNPELVAGITFSFPLENTKARAELSAAELKKAKALVYLKLTERIIATDIVDQVRSCNVFQYAAQGDQEVVALQKKKLSEEQKRFERGRSDTDTIIRFQEDLLSAQLRAAQSKFRYATAMIDLEQKQGTLLDRYWKEGI